MLQLKHLFHNIDLAEMILANWSHDKDNKEIMEQYRISANAVYPFFDNGNLRVLRFAPTEEKSMEFVSAELEFLSRLRASGCDVVKTIPSKAGKDLISCNTPWGSYTATVFEGAPGSPMTTFPYSHDLYYGYGQSLGKIHAASSSYEAGAFARPDWRSRLDWCDKVFAELDAAKAASQELAEIRSLFASLPKTMQNYGLIHYDYELDNVLFDTEHQRYWVLDFDDSLYHWFAMDVVRSIGNLREELPESDQEAAAQSFLEGYQSNAAIDLGLLEQADMFNRYANLFTYARIIRSIAEAWDNEPAWLSDLRSNLNGYKTVLESAF